MKTETVFAELTRDPQYESMTVELPDFLYDTYTITARAYINYNDDDDDYTAFGKTDFKFTNDAPYAVVYLNALLGDEEAEGTLTYLLINAVGFQEVTAELYRYDNEETKIILNQGRNSLSETGFYTIPLPTGYYIFKFGKNAPCVVHIYKNLETILEDEFTIYGELSTAVYPEESDVHIAASHNGIVSYGTDVTITITNGGEYRYKPGSVKLNNGVDNIYFTLAGERGNEVRNPDGTYTCTFRMPAWDVEISIETELIPVIDIDFSDPNMSRYIRFWSVTDNQEIDFAVCGETITVTFDGPTGAGTFAIQSWWLDTDPQDNDDPTNMTFSVPDPCIAWNVTAIVTIGNIPLSVSIPIRYN